MVLYREDPRRAADYLLQLGLRVEVEPVHGAEAIAQRAAEETLPGGRADAREVRQWQRGRARPHSLPEHRVETKIFERGIQRLFDDRVQSVDLIDEENITRAQVQEDRAEGALVIDRGAGADLDGNAQLVGDDVRQRGLAEPGRPAQEHMLDGLVAAPRGFEQDAEVLAHLQLSDVLGEEAGAQREVELLVVRLRLEHLVLGHLRPSALSAVASASCVEGETFQSTDSIPVRASCDE